MQRWSALVLAALAVIGMAALFVWRRDSTPARPDDVYAAPSGSVPGKSAVIALNTTAPIAAPPPLTLDAEPEPDAPAPSGGPADPAASSAPLPTDAPKQVTFAVALVAYRGAQGATPTARSKEEAEDLAKKVATQAKDDFAAAIKLADTGLENAGEMPRGVLEPGAEVVLFGLAVGEVSGPVDSPRGYYVFKRIE